MAAGVRLGAALRAATDRERPVMPSAAKPDAPCSTCRREARARANDSRASRCFGSTVGFESICVSFHLPPTAAWVSNGPHTPARVGSASRASWSDNGLVRRAQGVESLPQRQLIDPEIAGIRHRPESLLQERLAVGHGAGHDPGRLPMLVASLQYPLDGLQVGRVGKLPGNTK